MRKQDLKLDTMYALDTPSAFHAPAVLASLSDEFHMARGEVGRGSPTGRGLRTGRRTPASGIFPSFHLAIVRYPGVANLDEFTAWAEGGPVPAEHAEYLAVAQKVGQWLETLAAHHYTPVPDGLIPDGFRLAEVRTRDLSGEWVTIKRAALAADMVRAAERVKRHEKRAAEKAAYDELVEVAESFGLYAQGNIQAHVDHRFVTDYTRVVLPTDKLLDLLTSLRSEG